MCTFRSIQHYPAHHQPGVRPSDTHSLSLFCFVLKTQSSKVLNLENSSTAVSVGLSTSPITPLHQDLSHMEFSFFSPPQPPHYLLQQVLRDHFKEAKCNQSTGSSHASSELCPLMLMATLGPCWEHREFPCQGACVPSCLHPCASIPITTSKEEFFLSCKKATRSVLMTGICNAV